MIDLKTQVVSTVAGNGAKGVPEDGAVATRGAAGGTRARWQSMPGGNLYILERSGNALRVVETQWQDPYPCWHRQGLARRVMVVL